MPRTSELCGTSETLCRKKRLRRHLFRKRARIRPFPSRGLGFQESILFSERRRKASVPVPRTSASTFFLPLAVNLTKGAGCFTRPPSVFKACSPVERGKWRRGGRGGFMERTDSGYALSDGRTKLKNSKKRHIVSNVFFRVRVTSG